MKKILVSLLVLALCAPAMAATISINDNGDGTATVTIASGVGEANIVGLGLDVDVTAGDVTAVEVLTANFNIYPDAAHTQELGTGYVYGTGTPVAAKLTAGQIGLPQSSFALCFANLNGEFTAGANGAASVQVKLTLSATADLTVCENATRGGIVAVDGTALDAACATQTINVGAPPTEAIKETAPFYDDWAAFGKPDCWAYEYQCRGDADGLQEGSSFGGYRRVFNNDLNIFLSAYGVLEPPKGPGILTISNGICADFDHQQEGSSFGGYRRVFNNDLNIFLQYYGVLEPPKGPGIPPCDGANYNFFITP